MVKSRAEPNQESLSGEETESHQQWYRWVMLALLWLLYAGFGLIFRAIAPLVTPILKDLDLSYGQMGLILGSWPLTYILVAAIAGTVIDRSGIRKCLLAGGLIIGLSAVLRFFANGFVTMLAFVALFGVGGPMISIGGPKAISIWFRGRSRGTALGIYMTGVTIGGLLALSLTNRFVMPFTGYSWRLTFVFYGLLTFAVALLWWLLAKDTKPTAAKEGVGISEVFRGLIKVRNVQVLLIMGLLSLATVHGFNNWLPKILETGGLSPVVAGFAASIPSAAGVPAVIVMPHLVSPRLRGHFVALFALVASATLLVVVSSSGILLFVGLILFGLTASPVLPILLLILMDSPEVGSKYMGSAGGMFFCVAEIGGFTGPLIMGALADMSGAFLAGILCLAALELALSAMTLLLTTQPVPEPKAA